MPNYVFMRFYVTPRIIGRRTVHLAEIHGYIRRAKILYLHMHNILATFEIRICPDIKPWAWKDKPNADNTCEYCYYRSGPSEKSHHESM
jgi:hypothetical protein